MRTLTTIGVGMLIMFGSFAATLPAQQNEEGLGERIGEQLDRGVERIGRQLRRSWAEIRKSVDELGVQGRVYGRLRWDKAFNKASIDVQVQDENIVVLTGTVSDEPAQRKAVKLAQDTVGVQEVVSRLEVTPLPSE